LNQRSLGYEPNGPRLAAEAQRESFDRRTPTDRLGLIKGKAVRRPIRDLVRYYLRLGVLGFGGPVALVGQMERELVGEKKWLTKEEMREGIAVCQSPPGPLAIQVGIWISYIRGGFWGAWAGGWAFILPNFIIVTVLGALYVRFEGLPAVAAIFYGVSPAVIALILHSCYRLTKLGMKDWLEWALAAAAFAITVAVRAMACLREYRSRLKPG
jgi:chromate transporter